MNCTFYSNSLSVLLFRIDRTTSKGFIARTRLDSTHCSIQ